MRTVVHQRTRWDVHVLPPIHAEMKTAFQQRLAFIFDFKVFGLDSRFVGRNAPIDASRCVSVASLGGLAMPAVYKPMAYRSR